MFDEQFSEALTVIQKSVNNSFLDSSANSQLQQSLLTMSETISLASQKAIADISQSITKNANLDELRQILNSFSEITNGISIENNDVVFEEYAYKETQNLLIITDTVNILPAPQKRMSLKDFVTIVLTVLGILVSLYSANNQKQTIQLVDRVQQLEDQASDIEDDASHCESYISRFEDILLQIVEQLQQDD